MKPFFSISAYGKWLIAFFILFYTANIFAKPIHFIPNHGQWEDEVIARANINSGWFWMDKNGFTYLLYDGKKLGEQHTKHSKEKHQPVDIQVIKVVFEGADFSQQQQYEEPTSEYYNFFLGNDPAKWRSGIYGCHKIYFSNVYPEIDFVLYTNGESLKYDFIVKPGGDPNKIKISYQGQNSIVLGKTGDFRLNTLFGNITEKAPIVYQLNNFNKKKIKSTYVLDGNKLKFDINNYDKTKDLVIDPELIFSTFSGSVADNFGYTATYDEAGNGYSGGTVFAAKFPVTPGAFQMNYGAGIYDIGILKYTPDGSQLIYCTYLGGNRAEDPHSMVVNQNNELLVFGNTLSANFPHTKNAFDTIKDEESDIIISRFSADGKQLLTSTYIGGRDYDGLNGVIQGFQYSNILAYNYADTYRGEIITDNAGNIYIATTTNSHDFPIVNGFQKDFGGGIQDAVILKFNPDLTKLMWSTYLGGSYDDAAYSIAINSKGNIYICGGTTSFDFPKGANKPAYPNAQVPDSANGFIACISNDGTQYLSYTYFGTSAYDQCYFVQVDKEDNIFSTGQTTGGDTFNPTPGLYTIPNGGQFIIKLAPDLDTVLLRMNFGSGRKETDIAPSAFLVDQCGQIYFSGWGGGTNQPFNNFGGHGGYTTGLPVTENAIQSTTDGSDFYLAVFTHDLKKLIYGTFFGGNRSEEHVDGGTSRFDKRGVVYQSVCAGCGGFSDLPTTENAWSRINKGMRPRPTREDSFGCNNALFKMDINTHPSFSFVIDTCALTVQFTKDTLSSNANVRWDFGDNQTSTELNPAHKYLESGYYTVTVFTNYGTDCQDTSSMSIDVAYLRERKPSIYNVITPNNDGLNEVFHIPQLDAICEDYELKIYNRWGEYMYNEKGRNLKWLGTNLKGKDAAEGVYFYLINSPSFGELKGTITVLR